MKDQKIQLLTRLINVLETKKDINLLMNIIQRIIMMYLKNYNIRQKFKIIFSLDDNCNYNLIQK